MKATIKCRIKPYIQPFERKLAIAELQSLAGSEPKPLFSFDVEPLEFEVNSDLPANTLVERLAYWEYVCHDEILFTTQSVREATVNVVRNGVSPREIADHISLGRGVVLPNRRCLRYGSHGIHEYRGKFFPQLVRALINIAGVAPGGVVADPMSGSGTTAVEAVLAGCHALALDMNPLSVLMGRTKCALLSLEPDDLAQAYENVRERLLCPVPQGTDKEAVYLSHLPASDQQYLTRWFAKQVLADLDQIAFTVGLMEKGPVQDLMRLSLSNIIRKVSWQKEDDLRIRKEVKPDVDVDPVREFLDELGRSVRIVLAFLYQTKGAKMGSVDIREGDARELHEVWPEWRGRADVVITSPPYATALPYIDTDRLSLCYLGLLPRSKHRARELSMIGNREVSERMRQSYWRTFQNEKGKLPESVVRLIGKIAELNSTVDIGFRRRNLPALLAKFFLDMRDALEGISQLLRPGAPAYVVVGNNHTIAGGEKVEIETASLIWDVAATVGLEPTGYIPMEMLVSRDIFRKNAVASEVILAFRRPVQ